MIFKKLTQCGCSAVTTTNFQVLVSVTTHKYLISRFLSVPSNGCSENRDLLLEATSKTKERKEPKIPFKPFIRFSMKYRSLFQAKYPDIDAMELQKRLAMAWNGMSKENRAEYFDTYAKDAKHYFVDLDEYKTYMSMDYQKSLSEKMRKIANKNEQMRKRLLKKYFKMPKKVSNPYFLYCAEMTKQRNKKSLSLEQQSEFIKELGKTWKAMSEKEKSKYREQYDKNMLVYESLMVDWEREVVEAGFSFLLPENKRFDFQPTNSRYRNKNMEERNRLERTSQEESDQV